LFSFIIVIQHRLKTDNGDIDRGFFSSQFNKNTWFCIIASRQYNFVRHFI